MSESLPRYGLGKGERWDLTTCDSEGRSWDFSDPRVRERHGSRTPTTLFIVGSHPCTMFSSLQHLNNMKNSDSDWNQRMRGAVEHMRSCLELYAVQVREGRFFVHGSPLCTRSWQLDLVSEFLGRHDIISCVIDQCAYGLVTEGVGNEGKVPALKATGFITNSSWMAASSNRRCPGCHMHGKLVQGTAAGAAVYLEGVVEALGSGTYQQHCMGLGVILGQLMTAWTCHMGEGIFGMM